MSENFGKHGYAVIAVPESGLFVKGGRLETGAGNPMRVSELSIFTSRESADRNAIALQKEWAAEKWSFPVVPVLIRERP